MRILVSNDDGIYSPGLWAMVRALQDVAEVVVCAPDREQSGVGASITLHQPVRITEIMPLAPDVKAYSVEGTPGDCVIVALQTLLDGSVDAVFAGINGGSNMGNDVLLSGTVGAALQGYWRHIPSVAISVTALENQVWEPAARSAAILARLIRDGQLPRDLLLNVNLPNIPLQDLQGVEITRLGTRTYTDEVQGGHDGKRQWYWIKRGKPEWKLSKGTDIWAIRKKRISIAPLHCNLTAKPQRAALKGMGGQMCGLLQLHAQ